jgi:hypothetical protein
MGIKTINSDYSVTPDDDDFTILVDATSATITVTLPFAIVIGKLTVKKIDTSNNLVVIRAKGSDLIRTDVLFNLTNSDNGVELISNRVDNWWPLVQRQNESIIKVTDFGAVGDNSTPSASAFNLAIQSASAGDTILVPSGDYFIDAPIIIDKAITLKGEKVGNVCVLDQPARTTPIIEIEGGIAVHLSELRIKRGTIGLFVKEGLNRHSFIQNLDIRGSSFAGVEISGSIIGSKWEQISCQSFGAATSSFGWYIIADGGSQINGVTFTNCRVQGAGTGIHLEQVNSSVGGRGGKWISPVIEDCDIGFYSLRWATEIETPHIENNINVDFQLSGGPGLAGIKINGGKFTTTSAPLQLLFESDYCEAQFFGTRFRATHLIDGGDFTTSTKIDLVACSGLPLSQSASTITNIWP